MSARTFHRAPLVPVVVIVLAVVSVLAAPPSAAAADPPANPLDRVIVDVAALPSVIGSAGIVHERLLTLESGPEGTSGPALSARLTIIEHAEGRWNVITGLDVAAGPRPWLIEAGGGVFAVVSGSTAAAQAGTTLVSTVRVGRDTIEARELVTLDVAVTAGAAADTDGDGTAEIVLAGRSDRRRLGVCLGTRIVRLERATLAVIDAFELRELEFGGAVLGEFDGRPGAELAGLTRCAVPGTSPTDPRPAEPRLVGVGLRDGAITFELPLDAAAEVIQAADADLDGADELLISSERGPLLVDPGRRDADGVPATRPLADADAAERRLLPLLVAGGSETGPPLVVLAGDFVRVITGPLGIDDADPEPIAPITSTTFSGPRWSTVVADRERTAARREPAIGLWADLGDDGCLDLLMPGFAIGCRDVLAPGGLARSSSPGGGSRPVTDPLQPDLVIRRGPIWTASRPIATVGRGTATRVLVAQAVDPLDLAALHAPAPSIAWQGAGRDAWRTGPSGPFVLAELSLPDLLYFPSYPIPEPTMEGRAVGRPSVVKASGWSGSNYLVRIVALEDGDPEPRDQPSLTTFLDGFGSLAPTGGSAQVGRVVRIDVTPGHPAGADTAAATVPIEDVRTLGGDPARRWVVSFVAFNAWGEVSAPVTRVVTRDLSGPPMTIAAPFTSVPWPFSARITGVAEPGATVQVNGGEILTTTSRGSFETRVTLAPWPQDVTFRAVDETGNVTIRVISMMGGLDVRQLPWQVLVALLVLVAVLVGTIREGRRAQARLLVADAGSGGLGPGRQGPRRGSRRREGAWLAGERDDIPLPEIEEIPPTVR